MKRMRFIIGAVLVAVSFSQNLHLPLFQAVAWTSMLIKYSRANSLNKAAEMTFSGRNPCQMCNAIEQAQESSAHRQAPEAISDQDPRAFWIFVFRGPDWLSLLAPIGQDLILDVSSYSRERLPPPVPPPIAAQRC